MKPEMLGNAPGKYFEIGDGPRRRRLHAVIMGERTAKRPVALEAGLTAMSSCWHWVQEELSKSTRVLAYDRAGLGWSDPAEAPRHANNIAADLRELLEAANFPRPFVFVGHSMGGIFGRAYAARWPEQIAAMALLDSAHPDQMERSPQIKRSLRRFFLYLRTAPHLASCGATRVFGDFGTSAKACEGLPAIHKLATKEFFASPRHLRAAAAEAAEWNTSMNAVRDRRLGELPLVVMTAPVRCMKAWLELQKELAQLSTRSRHVVIEGASHITLLTNKEFAARVAAEISTLL